MEKKQRTTCSTSAKTEWRLPTSLITMILSNIALPLANYSHNPIAVNKQWLAASYYAPIVEFNSGKWKKRQGELFYLHEARRSSTLSSSLLLSATVSPYSLAIRKHPRITHFLNFPMDSLGDLMTKHMPILPQIHTLHVDWHFLANERLPDIIPTFPQLFQQLTTPILVLDINNMRKHFNPATIMSESLPPTTQLSLQLSTLPLSSSPLRSLKLITPTTSGHWKALSDLRRSIKWWSSCENDIDSDDELKQREVKKELRPQSEPSLSLPIDIEIAGSRLALCNKHGYTFETLCGYHHCTSRVHYSICCNKHEGEDDWICDGCGNRICGDCVTKCMCLECEETPNFVENYLQCSACAAQCKNPKCKRSICSWHVINSPYCQDCRDEITDAKQFKNDTNNHNVDPTSDDDELLNDSRSKLTRADSRQSSLLSFFNLKK